MSFVPLESLTNVKQVLIFSYPTYFVLSLKHHKYKKVIKTISKFLLINVEELRKLKNASLCVVSKNEIH